MSEPGSFGLPSVIITIKSGEVISALSCPSPGLASSLLARFMPPYKLVNPDEPSRSIAFLTLVPLLDK